MPAAKRMRAENGNEEEVVLELGDLACRIELFGATVVSFTRGDREALFVSDLAVLDGSKPIRGGIPVVFPVFGADPAGELPSHGFARTSTWKKADDQPPKQHKVTLVLTPEEATWKLHPHSFRLEYDVELVAPSSLRTSLRVMNHYGLLNEDPFEFQCLLHTYLNIGDDISRITVKGLEHAQHINQLLSGPKQVQQAAAGGEAIRIDQEVDRIYLGNGNLEGEEIVVERDGKPIFSCRREYNLAATKQHQCDVVVWNPWIDKSIKLADFGDAEYKQMLCIEPGNVGRRDVLRGGEDAVLIQVITML